MYKFWTIVSLLLGMLIQKSAGQEAWSADSCVTYALEHSLQAESQALTLDDTKHTLTEASLQFLPSIDAGVGLNTNFGRSINPETNTYINTSNLSNGFNLEGYLPLFDGLRNINGVRIAKLSKLREEVGTQQVERTITINTLTAYYQVVFAQGTLRIAEEELVESKHNLRKKQVEQEVGLSNVSEVAQLQSQVAQGEYNVIYYRGMIEKAMVTLKQEMNFPFGEELIVEGQKSNVESPETSDQRLATTTQSVVEAQPEVQMAKANCKIAKLQLSQAKAQMAPRLGMSGGLSTGYSRILEGYDGAQVGYADQLRERLGEYVQVSLQIPIFGGLSRMKNVSRKRNAYERAQIETQQKMREVEQIITETIIDLESYEQQCEQSVKNVESNTLAYETTRAKFDEGLVSVVDLQTTQTLLSKARFDQLKAEMNYAMQEKIVALYFNE